MSIIPKLWPGSTIVCIASGPSLTPEDVARCHRPNLRVIAINDAWRLAPWADVLYSSDQAWYPKHQGVPEFTGLKVVMQTVPRRWQEDYGLLPVPLTGDSGLELSPSGLRSGKNSGYAAINLAVHLGAARILLLGYDMKLAADGRPHFFGYHKGLSNPQAGHFNIFRRAFDSLREPIEALGIDVVNCTPGSALTVFRRADLSEALAVCQAREAVA